MVNPATQDSVDGLTSQKNLINVGVTILDFPMKFGMGPARITIFQR